MPVSRQCLQCPLSSCHDVLMRLNPRCIPLSDPHGQMPSRDLSVSFAMPQANSMLLLLLTSLHWLIASLSILPCWRPNLNLLSSLTHPFSSALQTVVKTCEFHRSDIFETPLAMFPLSNLSVALTAEHLSLLVWLQLVDCGPRTKSHSLPVFLSQVLSECLRMRVDHKVQVE